MAPQPSKDGRIPVAAVDEAVRRVLRIKLRAGLFERPYADPAREQRTLLTPGVPGGRARDRRAVDGAAEERRGVLPLATSVRRLAVIGPLADDRRNMMGNWTGDGREGGRGHGADRDQGGGSARRPRSCTRRASARRAALMSPTARTAAADRAGIEKAVAVARSADAVVLVIGEIGGMSGEASSRTSLDLPGRAAGTAQK